MLKVYRPFADGGNCIVTIAIGDRYLADWEKYALESWHKYAERNDLGLIAVTEDLIPSSDEYWKKATWQKLLLADTLTKAFPKIGNMLYLDTDILINPYAPNVFENYDGESYALVSKYKNLPYAIETLHRRFVFSRNRYYDSSYPLDSLVFASVRDIYLHSGLEPVDDHACAGFFMVNPHLVAAEMRTWFFKYKSNQETLTGGDQTHFNWEILRTKRVQWMPYEFQALWVF